MAGIIQGIKKRVAEDYGTWKKQKQLERTELIKARKKEIKTFVLRRAELERKSRELKLKRKLGLVAPPKIKPIKRAKISLKKSKGKKKTKNIHKPGRKLESKIISGTEAVTTKPKKIERYPFEYL